MKGEDTQNNDLKVKKSRIFEVDFIRGVAILLVLLDHIMFDFYFFGQMWAGNEDYLNSIFYTLNSVGLFYWYHPVRIAIRFVVIALFFLVSGISTSFSRNNFKRGAKMLTFALLLTLGSYLVSYILRDSYNIDFNVIHAFAVSTLIFAVMEKQSNKFLIYFSVFVFLAYGYIKILNPVVNSNAFLIFGITSPYYNAADYEPLIPWLGFFILGAVVGRVLYPERRSLFVEKERLFARPILFMGRHSLVFYFGQQIVVMFVMAVIGLIFGFWS